MSKAFTRESDGDEVIAAPVDHWPLPEGVPYYVTPAGLDALRAELAAVRAAPRDPPTERRQRGLVRRLEAARVIDPAAQPTSDVRFGVRVTVREAGQQRSLQIVGIDEADPARGRISFWSPMARALTGAVVGDVVTLPSPRGDRELEVVAIDRAR